MPTQRDSRLRVDERRCHRVLLLAAACSSTGSHRFDMASVSCLLLWQRRRKQWRPNAGGRGGRARARVRMAQGDGEPPLVAEGDGDRPWRAGCKSAYLHVRRPVLPSHDACNDTCNDTCIALSGRVQRHLYFDLLGQSAWSLLTSVAGIAGHPYDTVF
jgi:hypothetical protein